MTTQETTLTTLQRELDNALAGKAAAELVRDASIAIEQIRNTQRAIDLLAVVSKLIGSGMSSSPETQDAMSGVSKAREALRDKRDRELDERLIWQQRDWLASDLVGAQGDTRQRRAQSTR